VCYGAIAATEVEKTIPGVELKGSAYSRHVQLDLLFSYRLAVNRPSNLA